MSKAKALSSSHGLFFIPDATGLSTLIRSIDADISYRLTGTHQYTVNLLKKTNLWGKQKKTINSPKEVYGYKFFCGTEAIFSFIDTKDVFIFSILNSSQIYKTFLISQILCTRLYLLTCEVKALQ